MTKNPSAVSLGSLGGKAAAKNMTPEQRTARAKKAVTAREAKRKLKLIPWCTQEARICRAPVSKS